MNENNASLLRSTIDNEISLADSLRNAGNYASAFHHLERAHVLGQASTFQYTRIHRRMLKLGFKFRSILEILGPDYPDRRCVDKNTIRHLPNGQHRRIKRLVL